MRDNPSSYYLLFEMANKLRGLPHDVEFDFSACTFLAQNGVAFLGGLARVLRSEGRKVQFNWTSLDYDVKRNLAKNGFLRAFGLPGHATPGNAIPYRADMRLESQALVEYLREEWLVKPWIDLSPKLRDSVVGKVVEIYVNAFEHASSPAGVKSCGQHYPTLKKLALTVVDFGVGIPNNVREFIGNQAVPADKALEWAFTSGTTTRPNGISRGVGLDLLKKFVQLNKGELRIFSNDGLVTITEAQETYALNARHPFGGTVVSINLQCDERKYFFKSEVAPQF